MAEPVSTKLLVIDGCHFIVTGNPRQGYSLEVVMETIGLGDFKRSWQAVEAAHQHAGGADA